MTDTQIFLFALLLGAAIALLITFALLKRRGISPARVLQYARDGVEGAGLVTEALHAAFPKNEALSQMELVTRYAKIGVQKAEQLYRISEIPADARKQEATDFVRESLRMAGIEETPALTALADSCIEACVHSLGHTEAR